MRRQQLAAIVALVVGAATVALAVAVAVSEFPRGLGLLGCVVVAAAAAWYGVLRRGIARVAGLTVAALALAGAVALLVWRGRRSPTCWSWRVSWCRWRRRVPLLPCTWICPALPRRADRCCSSTRARVAARRSASRSPTRHARAGSSRSS